MPVVAILVSDSKLPHNVYTAISRGKAQSPNKRGHAATMPPKATIKRPWYPTQQTEYAP